METLTINSVIKTEQAYKTVLNEIEGLINKVEPNTPGGDRYELLCLLIQDYEDKLYPIDDPDPIEMIKFRMDQLNLKSKDLGIILGYKERASEILSRKRRLTLAMIRKINTALGIPMDILVREYELSQ
jgi:HTH-type transcriptional regulator/antitoxin HigA